VCFGNLAAQHEADARSPGLGCEERYEDVRRIRQAGALIVDPQLEAAAFALPADGNGATGLQRSVCRVVYEIDQKLLELIGIGTNDDIRSVQDADRQARLDGGDSPDDGKDVHGIEARRGQLGEARVRGREAAERIGSRGDDRARASSRGCRQST